MLENIKKKLRPFKIYKVASKKLQESRTKKLYSGFLDKNALAFDVGANIGDRTKALLEVGFSVVAIEPVEKFYTILKETFIPAYKEKIAIIQKGIGEEESVKTLYVEGATMSTFSEEFINDRKNEGYDDIWKEKVDVEITTLDNLIAEFGIPSFIKIDVEGYELNVLRGLTQPVKYISIEHIPTMRNKTLECLAYLMKISPDYKFNFLLGESIILVLKDWISYEEMIEIINDDNNRLNTIAYSDIFAKNTSAS